METIAPKITEGTGVTVKAFMTIFRVGGCLLLTVALCAGAQGQAKGGFSNVDQIMNAAVAKGTIPGGVVLVGHDGQVVYRKAYGMRELEPRREAMTAETVFDIASITKCVATASSVMKLVQEGKIRLNDPVTAYLPEFARNGKENITIRQLLTHFSGLPEDLDLKTAWRGRAAAFEMSMETKPVFAAGTRFVYSDINFETLGFVVEKVSGESLDEYALANVFEPLGMKDTRYLPPAGWRGRIAPTEYDESHTMLRGVVHDPTARRMGGVAGHAGVFSTADDLAKFAEEMLGGFRVLRAETVEKMTTPQQPPTATVLRGLGWDIDSPYASNRGEFLPVGSFGHTGFTGTSIWMDGATKSYVILLTNAVHPRGKQSGAVVSLRARVATAVTQALGLTVSEEQRLRAARITGYNEAMSGARLMNSRNGRVLTGIDVLEASGFAELRVAGAAKTRVALMTNHTGVDRNGARTIDVLAKAEGIELKAILSPEHGVMGTLDTGAIGNSQDAATGIPVYSVYGNTAAKKRPPLDVLSGVDAIVFDIQDIGARFYTYETTLGYFLEAAAQTGKPIFVLDRPNPINGAFVQGPISDKGRESFTNYGQVPVRHGMTSGELAKYYNAERGIHARLTVVKMEGWQRGDWLDATGLMWVNPSPNMRSLTEATLYTGVGMIESANISVGRGTDTPFEVVGAPWIHAQELAEYLNARGISGVRFVPVEFTPTAEVYAQRKCGGVNIVVTERNLLDAPELGLEIAAALHALYGTQFELAKVDQLMFNDASLQAIAGGEDPRRVWMEWVEAIEAFNKVRAKYLIY